MDIARRRAVQLRQCWDTKGPIFEYSFYECESGLATQWGPWGDTHTSRHDRPAAELHEHLLQACGAERTSQITWHTNPPPKSRLGVKRNLKLFNPPKDCQRPARPLDELYPNPANMPVQIGDEIVYLHADRGVTTASSSGQQASEHGQLGSLAENQETSTDSAAIEANSPAASSTKITPDSEKPNEAQPKVSWKKDKGKGGAMEQEQGEQNAQQEAATHTTSSVVRPPTQPSSIGSSKTREGSARQRRNTTAPAASAPSRNVVKSAEHKLQWNEDMKLCLWVMDEASETQLGDWGRKTDVWNKVSKNQKVFKDGEILSGSRKASVNQLRTQLDEHWKTEKEDQAHKPAIKQWVSIKAMDKKGVGIQAMERKVQAAIDALNGESGWTR
ncbi:hypothetical protein CBER1_06765 [Cercospora berteroae]|uniref:Uncharacterized protein n=1 Tax=Cercospora berteroae TaxID=357750 RepID=A0A2S6BSM0_9PEZI|nr:hypothetical protein CBER1_06765 [Cercospora berteroae]